MTTPSPRVIRVDLAGRSYDILIGRDLLAGAGTAIVAATRARACLIVSDSHVAPLHLAPLRAGLEAAGLIIHELVLPAGERTKSWPFFEQTVEAILSAKLERGDAVIALGGGVIGDLAGFASAVARRGMQFVQVPTSLLAQVDSSVGGKTGINTGHGKNLVGAFHQPKLVLADTALLDTLPLREMRAGYAEVVKYGLIDRPDFYQWLEAGAWQGIFAGGPEREEAVAVSCAAKAAIVARDETETGDRALLNLGHTFGHALEALVQYDASRLVHGEAVAVGMAMAHRYSARNQLCPADLPARIEAHLAAVGLPTRLQHIDGPWTPDAMFEAITQDKKVSRGTLTFILTRGLGQSFIARDVPAESIRDFLARECAL